MNINPAILEKVFDDLALDRKKDAKELTTKEAEKILDILRNQKKKKAILKKEFMLKSANPNGITLIKEILGDIKDAEIKYISAGKFIIKAESEDLKKTDNKIQNILKTISEKAKKDNVQFSVK